MNRRTRNNIIKITVFLFFIFWAGYGIFGVLNYKSTGGGGGWQRFYEEKKDSIDVIFFGSSHAHCTVDHGYLWENYGLAGYTLSAGSQTIDSTYFFVKEALKTQTPRVIAVEVFGAVGNEIADSTAAAYRNTMGMRWSGDLWKFSNYLAQNMEENSAWARELFLKIPIMHSRYTELEQADFEDPIPFMRGYRGSFDVDYFERPEGADTWETEPLNSQKEEWLCRIIDLAKEKNVAIVLFASPYSLSEIRQMQFNRIAEIAEENDVPFLNFNHLYDEIGLDFGTDMRDTDHVNNTGAVKVTEYLVQFLKNNYEIPDRRGMAGYELWEQNALYLRNKTLRHQLETAADINEYLQILLELEEDQTVILTLTGNYNALGEVYLEKLTQLGIGAEEYAEGGAWVFQNGTVIRRLPGQEYASYLSLSDGEIYLGASVLTGADGDSYEDVRLVVNGTNYRMIENGVSIVVYNEELNQVVDAAGDDIYLGLELVHNEKAEE